MGVTLTLSGSADEPIRSMRLCTNRGFDQLTRWLESLPPDQYPAAKIFATTMAYRPTEELANQLNAAEAKHRPPDDATYQMVELFLDRIGVGDPNETAVIMFGD